jgi:hypothetical protein
MYVRGTCSARMVRLLILTMILTLGKLEKVLQEDALLRAIDCWGFYEDREGRARKIIGSRKGLL